MLLAKWANAQSPSDLRLKWPAPPRCPRGYRIGPPDFVGIGAQKSGTTWWYALIGAHPGVFDPMGRLPGGDHEAFFKERHFFDWFSYQSAFRPRDYARLFPRPPGKLTGEFTPRYMHDFWTLPLLKRAAPKAKLIVMLRDPVERFFSGALHAKRYTAVPPYEIANDHFQRGFYHRQLRRVLEHFQRKQVLVLQFERCVRDPGAELAKTYRFLGLDDRFRPARLHQPLNVGPARRPRPDPAHSRMLAGLYRDDVRALAAEFPEIDLKLWRSSFR